MSYTERESLEFHIARVIPLSYLEARLVAALDDARAERDALTRQIAEVRERGVDHTSICDSWSDMTGSVCTCGVAILAESPVTPESEPNR